MTRPGEPVTVRRALACATSELARAGVGEPMEQARYLLAHLLEVGRGWLVTHGDAVLDAGVLARYRAWIARRSLREPPQHITGVQEFHGLVFRIDGRALIPRPETELLVDTVLALDLPRPARVLDVGTGSGCIAVTLAVKRPDLELVALDRSAEALALARENARLHGVLDRIEWVQGDLIAEPLGSRRGFAVVVSNPPYVSEAEWLGLEPEVRDHDPRMALVAGATGLEAYEALSGVARRWLSSDGRLVLELGFAQEAGVRTLLARAGFEVLRVEPDLRGIPRVLLAVRRESPEPASG